MHGCCADKCCNADTCMALPEGKTCADAQLEAAPMNPQIRHAQRACEAAKARQAAEIQRLRADLGIAESRKSDVIQRLSTFARECRDNWDCDTDAHTHGTLCRACEAVRVLTHGEGPR